MFVVQAHHAVANSYIKVLKAVGILQPKTIDPVKSALKAATAVKAGLPPPEADRPDQWEHPPDSQQLLLGFSATPYRFDEQDLEQLFPHRVFKIDLKTLMDAGHLCTLTSQRVSTTADLTAVKMTKLSGEWDFNERQLSQVGTAVGGRQAGRAAGVGLGQGVLARAGSHLTQQGIIVLVD